MQALVCCDCDCSCPGPASIVVDLAPKVWPWVIPASQIEKLASAPGRPLLPSYHTDIRQASLSTGCQHAAAGATPGDEWAASLAPEDAAALQRLWQRLIQQQQQPAPGQQLSSHAQRAVLGIGRAAAPAEAICLTALDHGEGDST